MLSGVYAGVIYWLEKFTALSPFSKEMFELLLPLQLFLLKSLPSVHFFLKSSLSLYFFFEKSPFSLHCPMKSLLFLIYPHALIGKLYAPKRPTKSSLEAATHMEGMKMSCKVGVR